MVLSLRYLVLPQLKPGRFFIKWIIASYETRHFAFLKKISSWSRCGQAKFSFKATNAGRDEIFNLKRISVFLLLVTKLFKWSWKFTLGAKFEIKVRIFENYSKVPANNYFFQVNTKMMYEHENNIWKLKLKTP